VLIGTGVEGGSGAEVEAAMALPPKADATTSADEVMTSAT